MPTPKTNIPSRKVVGDPATTRLAAPTAAIALAPMATATGDMRSASRPPTGAASSAPTENRLEAPAAARLPQPRVFAAYAYW